MYTNIERSAALAGAVTHWSNDTCDTPLDGQEEYNQHALINDSYSRAGDSEAHVRPSLQQCWIPLKQLSVEQ